MYFIYVCINKLYINKIHPLHTHTPYTYIYTYHIHVCVSVRVHTNMCKHLSPFGDLLFQRTALVPLEGAS